MSPNTLRIVIVGIPSGEAPLWVREKWVGLELPLCQKSGLSITRRTAGVLSGPRNLLAAYLGYFTARYEHSSGFMVQSLEAVDILAAVSPEAAEWWRANTPHILKASRCFMFDESVCRVAL